MKHSKNTINSKAKINLFFLFYGLTKIGLKAMTINTFGSKISAMISRLMKRLSLQNRYGRVLAIWVLSIGILLPTLSASAATGVKTEFDYKPRSFVPLFFLGSQFRSQDYMQGSDIVETLGLGGGFLYHAPADKFWKGHKFFYYYFDGEFQQEWNPGRQDDPFNFQFVFNPGIMIRSYIPFMKIFYGAGLSFRLGSSDFEPWGVYGQAGIEVYRVFLSFRLVGSPGEGIVHNEIRLGYMFTPTRKQWRN